MLLQIRNHKSINTKSGKTNKITLANTVGNGYNMVIKYP